jgi:AcrR family transcriptional regulator
MVSRNASDKDALSVRERLIDSADRLFYQEGFRAVGIDRVLAEAGAAKASLYAHFGSKDELMAACIERRALDARRRACACARAAPLGAQLRARTLLHLLARRAVVGTTPPRIPAARRG